MKKDILLVDDEPVCNFIARRLLSKASPELNVQEVLSGVAALAHVKNLIADQRPLPDLIMVDVSMPMMDGFQFILALRDLEVSLGYKPEIVMVTSSVDPADVRRAKELGVTNYISKPLTEMTIETLTSILNKKKHAA